MKRKTRGPDKKKRRLREYGETVRMQIQLSPHLANWVWTKSGDRPSKLISTLILQAMCAERGTQNGEG